jgi:serine phosphatase RsbU (regulator of sigma subunit)
MIDGTSGMAGYAQDPRRPARRARLLAMTITLVCFSVGLAFIPAASAKREHSKPSRGEATRSSKRESAKSGGGAPPAAGAGEASDEQEASGTPEAAGGQEATGAPEAAGGQEDATEATAQEVASTQGTATADAPGAAARKQKGSGSKGSGHKGAEHKGSEHKGSEHKKGSGKAKEAEMEASEQPHAKEEAVEASVGAGAVGAAVPTSTPAAMQLAVAPAPAAASAATQSVAPQASVARSGLGGAPRAARRPAHARRALARLQPAGTLARSSATGASLARATPARELRQARGSSHGRETASRSSPLVTTITRIVDVVPTALRVLVVGLLALALALAVALAVRSRLSARRMRRLERQRAELREDVGLLQAALLPVIPARLGVVDTSTAYQPAAGPGAGGDFYDVFALEDGRLAVIVGDVCGHGRKALPHTALVRFTLRAYLEAGLSPRDTLQTAGAVLERQLGGVLATVVVAIYKPRERVLVYACAGHPPPIVIGAGADLGTDARALAPITVCAAPPLGAGVRTGTRQTVLALPGRAQICFYTDGLTEARVGAELFGAPRLIQVLTELGPRTTAPALLAAVAERADARPDDMAACLLSVAGDERAPAVLLEQLELDREDAASMRTERFLLECGVERREAADAIRAAAAAAGSGGTVLLELRRGGARPEVALQREQLSYIHARRAKVEVAL